MYDQQQVFSDSLYLIVYGGSMIFELIGCIYLLFRRSNAFAPEVTPPLRLRHWVAAFFVVMLLSHISWYVFVKYGFFGDSLTDIIVAAALDCMVLIPLIKRTKCLTLCEEGGENYIMGSPFSLFLDKISSKFFVDSESLVIFASLNLKRLVLWDANQEKKAVLVSIM